MRARAALPFVAAALVMAGVSLAMGGLGEAVATALSSPDMLAITLLYGMGSLALSRLLWLMSVQRLGIGVASMHFNAAPFYVMLIAWSLGGARRPGGRPGCPRARRPARPGGGSGSYLTIVSGPITSVGSQVDRIGT
ncbi:hypothetical protein [Defluviimonas sp. WL0075]|uniref:EamA-like transporter family protein n=1 Tax=Albidovulum sediminicola TaxID=2984331 RepID=A0ABT2YY80_9RHOB|nr:hypothetical protein [Defluviimonas sp. WL0075]MCV2863832.1 hypothetical protein [Defluviimonas sp. WL0075]